MQVQTPNRRGFFASFIVPAIPMLLASILGCSGPAPITSAAIPAAQIDLAVACSDASILAEFAPRLAAWAKKRNAKIVTGTATSTDLLFIRPAELGGLAEKNELVPVPDSLLAEGSPFQWSGLSPTYVTALTSWGLKPMAVPVVAEGYAFVARLDRLNADAFTAEFRKAHNRDPWPIRTYEDWAEVAAVAAKQSGKPSLPPLPADAGAALTAFGQIAACYDRAPFGGGKSPDGVDLYRRGLSFWVDSDTGVPRIAAPAFREALAWFAATAAQREAKGTPLEALTTGTAIAAILPLGDVAKLPKDDAGIIESRFGVAPLPGTRSYFDHRGIARAVSTANFLPYFGEGGWLGAVKATSKQQDLAFELLAELAGPAGCDATIDEPGIGSGPLRRSQLGSDPRLWRQFRFDEERTKALGAAQQEYQKNGTLNPAIGLRTPDHAAIRDVLVAALREAAAGKSSADELAKVEAAWNELDAKTPPADRLRWRRKTAGME